MKKVFILGLGVALVAGGMSSCGKTSKGKMANEWAVSAYTTESTSTDEDGDKDVTKEVLNGTNLVTTNTYTPNGGTVSTSEYTKTVSDWSYTIDKDGSWNSVKNTTKTGVDSTFNILTFEYDTYVVTNNIVLTTSGVWNFIGTGKVEEFKKNERVMFSVLSEESKTTSTIGANPSVLSTNTETYLAGNYAMTYTVVESSGKELQLKSDVDYTDVDADGTYKYVDITTMTLTQK